MIKAPGLEKEKTTSVKKKKRGRKPTHTEWKKKRAFTKEEIKQFLSGVIRGDVAGFAGMEPDAETKIKAAKELYSILSDESAANMEVPTIQVNATIQDTTSKELKDMDKELIESYENE